MLDAFIIEQLKEREDERRHNFERPVLQLPIVDDADVDAERVEEESEAPRVIILEL